jgi:hypothetical protein
MPATATPATMLAIPQGRRASRSQTAFAVTIAKEEPILPVARSNEFERAVDPKISFSDMRTACSIAGTMKRAHMLRINANS